MYVKNRMETVLCLVFVFLVSTLPASNLIDGGVWQKATIVPLPESVSGVKDCRLDENDGWSVKYFESREQAGRQLTSSEGWSDYSAENRMKERTAKVRLLKKTITLPSDSSDKRLVIRFDGVSQYARLYVNGKYVRDHWGSIMSWTSDITDFVSADGNAAEVMLLVDESREGLSEFVAGRGYGVFRSSGLQRDVRLLILPENYVAGSRVETLFDDDYKNATLRVRLNINENNPDLSNSVAVRLYAPDGKQVRVTPSRFDLTSGGGDMTVEGLVKNPLKWDAEHPNLYKMVLTLYAEGKEAQTIERKIGFREVELCGRNLLVNGQEVKLRGMWGGDSIAKLVEMNVNHTRQKWVSEKQLDSCDMLGVYVLDEIPIDFSKYDPEVNPEYAYQWLSLMGDLMERDYSHPSVIMWGLGNESFHGVNVLAAYKFIKSEDSSRPVMFSWANRVKPTEEIPYDIYSFHYPDVLKGASEVSSYNTAIWHSESLINKRDVLPQMPVICDEYAHVVLSSQEVSRDPNVRNFWGESIKLFWDYMYNTDGALGGDQFGLFTGINNGTNTPEIWLTRKAYSPIHIEKDYFEMPRSGEPLRLKMQNRFCHTNMNEVTLKWSVNNRSGELRCPDIAPSQWGDVEIPVGSIASGDVVDFVFVRSDGLQVDEFSFVVDPQPVDMPQFSDVAPVLQQTDREIIVSGDDFKVVADKYFGQIVSIEYLGRQIVTRGPILQFAGSNLSVSEWWCDSISAHMQDNVAVIEIEGNYAAIDVYYRVSIDGKGLITTDYTIRNFPDAPPVVRTLPWNGTHVGGFSEIGIVYDLSPEVDRLSWSRKSLWTTYPKGHIGAPEGVAYKTLPEQKGEWATYTSDRGNFGYVQERESLYNLGFLAAKEYISEATALLQGCNVGLQIVSPQRDAVRMEANTRAENGISMVINNQWNYPTLGLGNYMKSPIVIGNGYADRVVMRLVDR